MFKCLNSTLFIATATKIISKVATSVSMWAQCERCAKTMKQMNSEESTIWASGMEVKVPEHQRTKPSNSCGQETNGYVYYTTHSQRGKQPARKYFSVQVKCTFINQFVVI